MAEPCRLSDYAGGIFHTIPARKGMKKAIQKGLVHINGDKAYTGDFLRGGEQIDLYRKEGDKPPIALNIKLTVLYEDEYFAAVNKPAGIVVSGNRKWTVENALRYHLTRSTLPDYLVNPQAIHRLDYPTTGVLLIGKTVDATTKLNRLFEQRNIQKTYHAITIQEMELSGIVNTKVDDKSALSNYKVLKWVPSEKYERLNLVAIKPSTGRKHQIRIHLSSIGNPIFGDKLYGKDGFIHKGKGLYLHASTLEFIHPYTQQNMLIEAPLPEKFSSIFE